MHTLCIHVQCIHVQCNLTQGLHTIMTCSALNMAGTLRRGDQLLSANDESLEGITCDR